jgi:hypothetical protein
MTRSLILACEILPQVDVRAVYSGYFKYFLLWTPMFGLFVKFVYLLYFKQLPWTKRVAMDVAMNAASSLLNLVAFPMALLVWILPELAVNRIFGTDDADPVNWVAILLIIAMIGALSEAAVLRFAFRQQLGQRAFWLLYVANVACIAFMARGMGFYIAAHPPTA